MKFNVKVKRKYFFNFYLFFFRSEELKLIVENVHLLVESVPQHHDLIPKKHKPSFPLNELTSSVLREQQKELELNSSSDQQQRQESFTDNLNSPLGTTKMTSQSLLKQRCESFTTTLSSPPMSVLKFIQKQQTSNNNTEMISALVGSVTAEQPVNETLKFSTTKKSIKTQRISIEEPEINVDNNEKLNKQQSLITINTISKNNKNKLSPQQQKVINVDDELAIKYRRKLS